jgi:hypothetical protein
VVDFELFQRDFAPENMRLWTGTRLGQLTLHDQSEPIDISGRSDVRDNLERELLLSVELAFSVGAELVLALNPLEAFMLGDGRDRN